MKLVKFEPEHIMLTQLRESDRETMGALTAREKIRLLDSYKYAGPAWTLVDKDNLVVACGGVVMMWSGVGEAWIVFSTRAKRYPVALFKYVDKALKAITKTFELHRVQTVCIWGHEAGYRWLEKLGFRQEGRADRYLPGGQDVMRFRRLS
jgi:hypothetical protein